MSGQDPGPFLKKAYENLAKTRSLGGALLDAEQHAALAHWVQAEYGVRKGEDPAVALAEMGKDLEACFKIAPQDAMCRTLAAQADWVRADWLAKSGKPAQLVQLALEAALAKAKLATQSKEIYPDAWQVLAETELRLARALSTRPALRDAHLSAGLDAVRRTFAINPNHALAHATQGEIQLLLAQQASDVADRRRLAGEAKQALERAKQKDAFLNRRVTPSLATAASLLQ